MSLQDIEYSSLCYWIDWGFPVVLFVFLINLFLFLAALRLCCAWAFSSCGEWGLSLAAGSGATLHCAARASPCSGFTCGGAWALGGQASVVAAWGLGTCGTQGM